jgi:hypothetical protein
METAARRLQLNSSRLMVGALWALALAGVSYLAALTLWLAAAGLTFPYQLDYGEGFLLHFVRQWSQGQPIYKAAAGYPYILANYPPLAIVLALALVPLLGLGYAAGRIWTLLAIVAVAALVAAWIRRQGGPRLVAVAAALLLVGSPTIYHWAPLFRVDLLGLALTLGGLYAVAVAYPPRPAPGRTALLWAAVVLFVAALYAKQSFLFAPAAAVAYLLVARPRAAVALVAGMGLLGGGLFLLINLLSRGGFWFGLVGSNVNPFLWPEFWKQQADFWGTFAPIALLAALYMAEKFWLRRHESLLARLSPLDFYLPAALLSLWFAGKAGAWENYFFEAQVALTLAAGLALARLAVVGVHGKGAGGQGVHSLAPGRVGQAAVPVLVLLQVGFMWHTPHEAVRYLRLTAASNEAMAPILAATPDPIFSEDMGLLVTNDKVLDYCSFQYSQLARAGRWDQAWELGRLRSGEVNLVVLETGTRLDVERYQRFTREFLSELDRSYRHEATVGKYELYRPDPLQREGQAAFGSDLALAGWSLEGLAGPALEPGQPLTVTVVWRTQQAPAADYTAFAHLVDEAGQGWAGDDHRPYGGLYPTSAWGAAEMVRDRFNLALPADAPSGLYHLQVGWYDPASGERLAVAGGGSLRLAVLPVRWSGLGSAVLDPLAARFGPAIALEGWAWQAGSGELVVTLRWAAAGSPAADYTVFLHVVRPGEDQALAQGDAPPLGGRWPTSLWLPGLRLDDEHRVPLPADLPAGPYELLVGLYDPATGARLPLAGGSDALRLPVALEEGD